MNSVQQEQVTIFNRGVSQLLTRAEKKSREELETAQLQRLKKLIQLTKNTLGENALINEAGPFLIGYKNQLLDPNVESREQFFLTIDARTECERLKLPITKQYEFVIQLIDSIRKQYVKLSRTERDEIYSTIISMFTAALKYERETLS